MEERAPIGRASTPQGGRVELARQGEHLTIFIDDLLLMSSSMSDSEVALGEVGCRDLGPGARVLIGGLGLGYTLRAALDALPSDAEVICVELLESIVRWHREGPLGELCGDAIRDPRVKVRVEDVVAVLFGSPPEEYDAILLDVDNGPVAMTVNGNGRLYTLEGLGELRRRLRPGGRLVIWSADELSVVRFWERMEKAGFDVERKYVPAGTDSAGNPLEHVLYIGTPAAQDAAPA